MWLRLRKKLWKRWKERRIRLNALSIGGFLGPDPISFVVERLTRNKQNGSIADAFGTFGFRTAARWLFHLCRRYVLVKDKNVQATILGLSVGVALAAEAALILLYLVGHLTTMEWFTVLSHVVCGFVLIGSSVSALYSPPSASYPRWTQWAMLVIGTGFLISAVVGAWTIIGADSVFAALLPVTGCSVS
jgi:hypothetical protein